MQLITRPRTVAFVLIILLLATTAQAQSDTARLTLAAYNVKNLFDQFDDPYTKDETDDAKSPADLQALADVLRALNADILALVEVENEGVLRAFADQYLSDLGYRHIAVSPTNSPWGMSVGIMSRQPISRIASYRFCDLTLPDQPGKTWRFARDLLHVTIPLSADQALQLFIVHFKSRRDSRGDAHSTHWRLAEAAATHQVINDLLHDDPQSLIALLGDCNDTPASATLNTLLDAGSLLDIHAPLPADQRITYLREPYRSTVDYLLVSPALYALLQPASARVLHDQPLLRGSDHAPLAATFVFPFALRSSAASAP
jgi:endonuclease/exonuclease/phosphatase family metal-dependent hydrolase